MSVKKIAVIGAGPTGLVSLNEFLHTGSDGKSTITSYESAVNAVKPESPAFEEVVVFERGANLGGTWNYSAQTDPKLPKISKDLDYSKPESIRAPVEPPSDEILESASKEKPYIRDTSSEAVKNDTLWDKSGIYDHLFTNVPESLMQFSSAQDLKVEGTGPDVNPYHPFITHEQVLEHLHQFAKVNDLYRYIRFNSSVEKVYKKDDKWVVVVLQVDRANGTEKWYSETFDALLLANGRFNVPFVPKIPNLEKFRGKSNLDDAALHTKAFRNAENYRNEKVLVVGSSISAVDIIQYLIPVCKEVWISRDLNKLPSKDDEPSKPTGEEKPITHQWLIDILTDDNAGYKNCARIKRILDDGVGIEFEDGTIANDFDRILFATGYHLSYPFLIENEQEYIKKLPVKANSNNHALGQLDNVYLYTFSLADPTLAFSGVAHNSLFILTSEVTAAVAAGVWSGAKELPSIEEREKWCDERRKHMMEGSQVIPDYDVPEFFKEMENFAPKDRVSIVPLLNVDYVKEARLNLKKLFYEIVAGKTV